MIIYEVYDQTKIIQFATEIEAQNYANANNMQIRQIEKTENNENVNREKQLQNDLNFGAILIKEFLLDNRLTPTSFTDQMSIYLLQKFQTLEALCRVGDIRNISNLLPTIETDTIFTQERKDKYMVMVENYILNERNL